MQWTHIWPPTHPPILIESTIPTHPTHSIQAPAPVEWALTCVFTIELVLRYYVAEDR